MAEELETSRRTFLGGAIAVAGATLLPIDAHAGAIVIHADGVTDDTPGLQALYDGRPVRIRDETAFATKRGGKIFIKGGNFRIEGTLLSPEDATHIFVEDATFSISYHADDSPFIQNNGKTKVFYKKCNFIFDTCWYPFEPGPDAPIPGSHVIAFHHYGADWSGRSDFLAGA